MIVKYAVYFTMRSKNMQKYRFLSAHLPPSNKRQLVVLTGARQTGKTTLVKRGSAEV